MVTTALLNTTTVLAFALKGLIPGGCEPDYSNRTGIFRRFSHALPQPCHLPELSGTRATTATLGELPLINHTRLWKHRLHTTTPQEQTMSGDRERRTPPCMPYICHVSVSFEILIHLSPSSTVNQCGSVRDWRFC